MPLVDKICQIKVIYLPNKNFITKTFVNLAKSIGYLLKNNLIITIMKNKNKHFANLSNENS